MDRWVVSEAKPKSQMGKWVHTAGKWHGDKNDKGIQTGDDARFYGVSAKMTNELNNESKDLILQFTVKHEQKIDCGGAYIKLLPSGLDQSKFGGDSDYAVMFGPDICGSANRRTHAIFTYKGTNLLSKKDIRVETDQVSHLYTLVVKPDNSFEVKIDNKSVEKGSLFDNWDFLKPKLINDPNVSKPTDWVDEKTIIDPNDVKPDGYDDIPEHIPDPDAVKPDGWDDEDDGEWEAPKITNPDYKGPWYPKSIPNPAYKGEWVHPQVANPDFVDDQSVYHVCKDCFYVGFELWQVKSGTIFDDIIVTDSLAEAEAFANETWGARKDEEKKMFDKHEEDERKAAEDRRKKEEEERRKEADSKEEDANDNAEWEKDEL
jgi:calreticulin